MGIGLKVHFPFASNGSKVTPLLYKSNFPTTDRLALISYLTTLYNTHINVQSVFHPFGSPPPTSLHQKISLIFFYALTLKHV
jgi:hypothetical protein